MHRKNIYFLCLTVLSSVLILLSGMSWTAWAADGTIPNISLLRGVTIEEGQSMSNVVTIGGSITVLEGAEVSGNAVAIAGDIVLEPNTQVNHAFTLVGKTETSGAPILGTNQEILGQYKNFRTMVGPGFTLYLLNVVLCAVMAVFLAALGSILVFGFQTLTEDLGSGQGLLGKVVLSIRGEPLKNWLSGLFSLGVAAGMLWITQGSLLWVLMLFVVSVVLAVASILGLIVTAICLGGELRFVREINHIQAELWVGMGMLWLLSLTPLGGIIPGVIGIAGLGAVLHFEDGLWSWLGWLPRLTSSEKITPSGSSQ